mmetsp:Transcript_19194/g.57868  ORF Transcript_19194/g.57868 Transcript_19194/m.57868 type:complete len:99 (+) Transcript_19194:1746-2042(+)
MVAAAVSTRRESARLSSRAEQGLVRTQPWLRRRYERWCGGTVAIATFGRVLTSRVTRRTAPSAAPSASLSKEKYYYFCMRFLCDVLAGLRRCRIVEYL